MTVLYEVKTGHTKEVLKAFAKFYNEIGKNNKKIMFRYGIAAVCFLMLPRALKLSGIYPAICWGVGLVIIILAFARTYLTYFGLLGRDIYYKYNIKINMSFGHSGFIVEDNEKNTYKYHMIREMYADNEMYYLYMESDDLFIIPKTDFVSGSSEKFYDFMQQNASKEFKEVHISLKQKFIRMQTGMQNQQ